jgi:hypothetical protein
LRRGDGDRPPATFNRPDPRALATVLVNLRSAWTPDTSPHQVVSGAYVLSSIVMSRVVEPRTEDLT